MGLFKKVKDGMDQAEAGLGQAAAAQQFAQQHATQAPAEGQIGIAGLPVDPAAMGGPSSAPLDADDPMLQPVNGIGIAEYAAVAKIAQERGVTTEEGMAEIAGEQGFDPATFAAAVKEWVSRMGQSMVVGQEFRKHMGY
ncbi:MAG: hypothetical protein MUE36_06505 [Acidimicrobiales bacterium]|jgi:hypothetical protein|nr:hypothetical protein [Acidimicrobiales bacterium]